MGGWRNNINQSQVALEWLTWCDGQLRQQALTQLTPEDLEDHDRMARAYPDHPHPAYRSWDPLHRGRLSSRDHYRL